MTLKQKNQPQLMVLLAINILLIWGELLGWNQVSVLLKEVLKGDLSALGKLLILPAMTGIIGLIGWSIPKAFKETLVSWRTGQLRLPSGEAFTRIAPGDPRIDKERLEKRVGEIPIAADKQNALWYSIYRTHSKEASVNDTHGAYLLYRDMTALIPFLMIVVVGSSLVILGSGSMRTIALVMAGLIAEMAVVMFAARNAGVRLVANVLAIEAALQPVAKTSARKPRTARTNRKSDVSDPLENSDPPKNTVHPPTTHGQHDK
jgi:hypothetical protein